MSADSYKQTAIYTSSELAEAIPDLEIVSLLFDEGTLDKKTALQLELAYQEAVANALEHGNLDLPSEWREEVDESGADKFSKKKAERLRDAKYSERSVQISIEVVDSTLLIEIEDEGEGFNWDPEDVLDLSSGLTCHGRGLTLMYKIMDKIIYTKGGRRLSMTKELPKKVEV